MISGTMPDCSKRDLKSAVETLAALRPFWRGLRVLCAAAVWKAERPRVKREGSIVRAVGLWVGVNGLGGLHRRSG